MTQFLLWFVAVELLGLAALPLTLTAFPRLTDRGYGLAKIVGILVLTWLNWLLGLTLGAANLPVLLWPLAVALAGLGLWTLRRRSDDPRAVVRGILPLIIVEEGVFIAAFVAWTLVRASHPDIYGTEKPMDLMYLTTAMEHGRFAPPDLWLAGSSVNYYYLGYTAMATVATMAGVPATIAFNLALALLFGLTLSGACALGVSLTRSYLGAALAAAFVGLAGNLSGFTQWLSSGSTPGWSLSSWCATRVIGGCNNYTTITEFPFFSFVWGDLHPHVIALPFALLCLGIGLHIVLTPEEGARAFGGPRLRSSLSWPSLGLYGLALGSLYAINSWDLPAYLLLAVAGLVAGPYRRGARLGASVRAAAPAAVALVLLSLVLWLPFWVTYHSSARGVGVRSAWSSLGQYLLVNGAFLAPIAILLVILSWPAFRRWYRAGGSPDRVSPALGIANTTGGELGGELGALPVRPLIVGLGVVIAAALIAAHAGVTALALALLALIGYRLLGRKDRDDPRATFGLLATALAMGLTLLTEFVYLRDIFDGAPQYRMNTVFKFYYEQWLLLGLAAAWAFATAWRWIDARAPHNRRTGFRATWIAALALVVVTTGTYTALAIPSNGTSRAAIPTLDGMAYLKTVSPDDYAAITWLRANAPRDSVVAEAVGGDYWGSPQPPDRPGQVAVYSGLPTLLEAAGSHEGLWHPNDPLIGSNGAAATAIYGPDMAAARAAIAAARVRYVYVGPQEAQTYGGGKVDAPNLTKFAHFMRVAYHVGAVTIYQA